MIKEKKLHISEKDVLWLVQLIKVCGEKLQSAKHEKKVIVISNKEKFERVLPLLQEFSKQTINQRKSIIGEFLKDFQVIFQEGKYKIVNKSFNNSVSPKLKSFKDQETKENIKIVSFTSASLYGNFKEEDKEVPPTLSVSEVTQFTESLQSLIALSSYAESQMMQGNYKIAAETKREIQDEYDIEGRRFCNCYSAGYVNKYMEFLKNKGMNQGEIEEKMWELSKMPIFFASNSLSESNEMIDELIDNITIAINQNQPYIAIHGLGFAAGFAKRISEYIVDNDLGKNYPNDNKTERKKRGKGEFIYIWYNLEGESFYNIFRSLFI